MSKECDNITREDKKKIREEAIKLKYEVAEELGYMEKINEKGWRGLSSREAGQIGGVIAKKNKDRQ